MVVRLQPIDMAFARLAAQRPGIVQAGAEATARGYESFGAGLGGGFSRLGANIRSQKQMDKEDAYRDRAYETSNIDRQFEMESHRASMLETNIKPIQAQIDQMQQAMAVEPSLGQDPTFQGQMKQRQAELEKYTGLRDTSYGRLGTILDAHTRLRIKPEGG